MSALWGPRSEAIINWASRFEARALLPDLVRRLLLATRSVERVDMAAGASVDGGGWDGVVNARFASPFCPAGVSVWELSTEGGVKSKANRDIIKREKAPPKPIQDTSNTTYVAVTARRFSGKAEWITDQQKRGRWKAVRVVDADDLALWLAQSPAVLAWFSAEQLDQPIDGWCDLKTWVRRWERRCHPPLPAAVVLNDRDDELVQLDQWFSSIDDQPDALLTVVGRSRDEAAAFVAAAVVEGLRAVDDNERTRWDLANARTLVVDTPQAWKVAAGLDTQVPLVLMPAFAGFDLGSRSSRHGTVVPTDRAPVHPVGRSIDVNEPLPWQVFIPHLLAMGKHEDEARRLASQSGGELTALRRSLGGERAPLWVEDAALRPAYVAMLWMGGWRPRESNDDLQLLGIFRISTQDFDAAQLALLNATPPALVEHESGWQWASHRDAWECLAPYVGDADLDRFRDAALKVLGETDPRFDLPESERWMSLARADGHRYSDLLRERMADSLAFVSLWSLPNLSSNRSGRKRAAWIVQSLLEGDWRRWASLSELLPTLAEAAPRQFLTSVAASLDHGDEGVAHLMSLQPAGGLMKVPYLRLLWALEILGWDDGLAGRAASCLARLAAADPGGNIANRPAASLAALFNPYMPQTLASGEKQRELLEAAPQVWPPGVAFDLMRRLVQSLEGGEIPQSQRPRFQPWLLPSVPKSVPSQLIYDRVAFALERALEIAGTDPGRWAALVSDRLDVRLPRALRGEVLERLESVVPQIVDGDGELWRAILRWLDDLCRRNHGAVDTEHRRRCAELAERLEPLDPIAVATPRFKPPYILIEPNSGWQERHTKIKDWQRDFLDALANKPDALELVGRLIAAVDPEFYELGSALARSALADAVEEHLLAQPLDTGWRGCMRGFTGIKGYDWFEAIAPRLVRDGREDEVVNAALGLWPCPRLWDILDASGEEIAAEYWRTLSLVGEQDDHAAYARALPRLLAAHNISVAFGLASMRAEHISTDLLISTLEAVLRLESLESIEHVAHQANDILKELWTRDGVDLERAAMAESVLLINYGARHRKPRFVDKVLNTSPAVFADRVSDIYRKRSEPDPVDPPSDEAQARARWAYRMLSNWNTFPGHDIEDPDQAEKVLEDWAREALTLTKESDRQVLGELEVAKVLCRRPHAEDGHWPCMAARRLLEAGRHPDLARGLGIAKVNQWGNVARFVDDGTRQEQLADAFEKSAIALGHRWPRTAEVLDDLVSMHREGARSDKTRNRERAISAGSPKKEQSKRQRAMTKSDQTRIQGLRWQAVGPTPQMSIDFASRLNLITGENGLGKTFLLDTAWWSLTGSWPSHVAMPYGTSAAAGNSATIEVRSNDEWVTSEYHPRDERWTRPGKWPKADALVVYARIGGGVAIWDPEDPQADTPPEPTVQLTRDELREGKRREDGSVVCEGLITDWLSWQARKPEAFERLMATVRDLFAGETEVKPGEPVQLGVRDSRDIPTLRMRGNDVPITLLSAGMARVLSLAYALQWSFDRHRRLRKLRTSDLPTSIVFLIDEVEAHLHPRWQRALLPALMRTLEGLQSELSVQLIATTHAPFVAASCESIFDDDKDGLYVFESEGGQITLEPHQWVKFGEIADWLTSPVFGLKRSRSLEGEKAIEAANAFMRGDVPEDPSMRSQSEIQARLEEVLAGDDSFWPRWISYDGAAQ